MSDRSGNYVPAEHRQGVPLPATKKVLVCIDYEGQWGMPFEAPYDLEMSTHKLLEVLRRHRVHATFFTVGLLAIEHPDIISDIASQGHEIGMHGWRHEHMNQLNASELEVFGRGLEAAEAAIESATGKRPAGFRASYLLGPRFFEPSVSVLLADHGYSWTSNRELRHVVELLRPSRIGSNVPWRRAESRANTFTGIGAQMLTLALNARMWRTDRVGGSTVSTVRWLRSGCPPFYRGNLLEIPLYSPMDCDLLGFPGPSEPTDETHIAFTRFALRSCLGQAGPFGMLTFHDWIIAGANRLALFDQLLSDLAASGAEAASVEECWQELIARATPPCDSANA